MSLIDAEKLAVSCLKQVMEEKISRINVELCVISKAERVFTVREPEYINSILT